MARLWAIRKSHAENGADCQLEPLDRLQHLEKRLGRQVLGVVPVADAHVQIAVDAIEMEQVELLERSAIALLAAFDEPPNVGSRILGGTRRSLVASSAINAGMPRWAVLVTRRRPQAAAEPNPTRLSRANLFTYTTRWRAIV